MGAAPAPLPALPCPGDFIAGKYQVEEVLGVGGMGGVVAARHVALRQRVAIKFLLPAAMRLPHASDRFLREAQAAVAIQSEHVARVLDVGKLENGAPYMVMEHLSGMDLARLLKQRGPLAVAEAVDFVLQAGEAIAEAHTLGIVHRDLKPANLFLTTRPDGSSLVKVLDFGLSKMEDEGVSSASLTASGIVVGTPHYMSPEQLRSLKKVDARTDIWALGVILYELVTGQRPFDGPSLTAICVGIATDTPKAMMAFRPDLPKAFDAVVHACLEKDVDRRIPSMPALARGLAAFATPQSTPSLERIARFAERAAPTRLLDEDIEVIAVSNSPVALAKPLEVTPATPSPASPAPTAIVAPPTAPSPVPTGADAPDGTTMLHANSWGQTKPIRRREPRLLVGLGVAVVLIGAGALMWMASSRGHTGTALSQSPPAGPGAAAEPSTIGSASPAPDAVAPTSSTDAAASAEGPATPNKAPASALAPASSPAPRNPPPEAKQSAPSSSSTPRPMPKAASNPLDRLD